MWKVMLIMMHALYIHVLHKHAVESILEVEMNRAYGISRRADVIETQDYAVVN